MLQKLPGDLEADAGTTSRHQCDPALQTVGAKHAGGSHKGDESECVSKIKGFQEFYSNGEEDVLLLPRRDCHHHHKKEGRVSLSREDIILNSNVFKRGITPCPEFRPGTTATQTTDTTNTHIIILNLQSKHIP
jgi:hypothetical protein